MDHPLISLIDQQIAAAEKRGDFENLPGAGKPLANLDQPKDAVLDRLAAEAEAKPLTVLLKQQIAASQARLKPLVDERARKAEMQVLADLQLRLAIELETFKRFG